MRLMRFRYASYNHTYADVPMQHVLIENDAKHEIDTSASPACLKSEMQKRTTWKRINSRINVLWWVISGDVSWITV